VLKTRLKAKKCEPTAICRLLFSVFYSILFAVLVSSCSGDTQEPKGKPDPVNDNWWGYFDGTFTGTLPVDNMSVSFENNESHTHTTSNYVFSDRPQIGIKNMDILYIDGNGESEGSYISLSISGLVPGTKYITKSKRVSKEDDYDNTVRLTRNYLDGTMRTIVYTPREDKPFVVEIQNVMWPSSYFPAVKGRMRGTLHGQGESGRQETITIDATFGVGAGLNSLN
jgi:hypothetical protein